MNAKPNFPSAARQRLIILAWFCLVSSFSLATPVPPCPATCECSAEGGGLRKASCSDVQWNGVAFPDIRILVLRPSQVDVECTVPGNVSQLFPQLNSISLRNCSLATLPSDTFHCLELLQEVDLSHNSFSHFSQYLFMDNMKLRYVNLENNPLNVGSHPLLWSDTVWEANLASCDLGSRLPASTLAGLPNLRYLSLANNRLEMIAENSLPSRLKRLDLSGNSIVDVPLSELHRLKGLKEIDVSRNPVNCTCQLMGFQNWVSSEGTIFRNQIKCALPAQYTGYSLVDVPQHRLCDTDNQWLASNQVRLQDGYPLGEQLGQVAANEDNFLFDVEIGRVIGEESGHRHSRRFIRNSVKMPKTDNETILEGSGLGEETILEGSGLGEETILEGSGLGGTNSTIITQTISLDIGTTTPQKESELTKLTNANYVDQETVTTLTTVLGGGDSTSQEGEEDGKSDLTTTWTSSTDVVLSKRVEDPIAQVTSPLSTDSTEVPNSTNKVDDLATTLQSADENETESTTTLTVKQQEVKSQPVGSVAARNMVEEQGVAADTPAIGDNPQTATLGASERNNSDGTNATGQPMLGEMAKNETVQTASSTPYIIPSLLIVAVALVCLAIYFSQHNCRPKKSWHRGDAKANGPATELQDVSLLRVEAQRRDPDLYSKKYETEGRNPQTEKLTNGDGGAGDGADGPHPAEENGVLLADHRLPPVKISTTRVTTNYESLPKTPIIIQKS